MRESLSLKPHRLRMGEGQADGDGGCRNAEAAQQPRRTSVPTVPTRSWKPEIELYPAGTAAGKKRTKLVLFIHGIVGSEATTFGEFPELLRRDPDISGQYDIATFGYRTALLAFRGTPHPNDIARELKTVIDYRFAEYSEIVILAHSMGGLITRRYIADVLMARQPPKVARVIYFATPHMGALAAKLGSIVTTLVSSAVSMVPGGGTIAAGAASALGVGPSEQAIALGYDSRFLQDLMQDEASCRASDNVWAKFVLSADDKWVGTTSAWGPSGPTDFEVVPDTDHSSLVKPETTNSPSFLIARHVLLAADTRPPWAADPDPRQPNLVRKNYEQTEADRARNRFIYWNRVLPFNGRDSEEKALAGFLGGPKQRFRWLLISGPGGIGKSRIALELVLAQASGWWNAGFLDPEQKLAPDWALWQPRLPTLMIVDYAGRDTMAVAKMLKGLAEREAPHLLRYPVRVVLIERDAKGPWLDTITRTSRIVAGEAVRAPDLALRPAVDVWPIFEHVLGKSSAAAAGRETTLKKLAEIDKQLRPLFAYLMADAMRNGRHMRRWDRAALLHDLIERERQNWLSAARLAGLGDQPPDIAAEERALVLATMVATTAAPLTRDELDACRSPLLPTWKVDGHPSLFAAMSGGDTRNAIRPLEPDIVGEFFALETLSRLSGSDARALVERAWHIRPNNVWWFVSRCAADFPDHSCVPVTYAIEPETLPIAKSWAMVAFNLINNLFASNISEVQRLHAAMKALANAHAAEPGLLELWANATVNIIGLYGSNLSEAQRLHDEMKEIGDACLTEPALQEKWASATVNVIDLQGSHLSDALRLHGEMRVLADAHPDKPALREKWANATVNLIVLQGSHLSDALRLHGEMKTLADTHPTEPALREEWARAAVNLIIHFRASNIAEAQRVHGEIKSLSDANPDEPALRENWARAAVIVIIGLHGSNLPDARRLHSEMKALADAHPTEPALREKWARASVNIINHLLPTNFAEAQRLHVEMKTLANAHLTEPALREKWARAAINLINYLRLAKFAEAQRLHGEIRALAEAHPAEPALREKWTRAAAIVIIGLHESNLPEARRLHGEMKAFADAHPTEPTLRENWATAALLLIIALHASNPSEAQRLHEQMKVLADAHPNEDIFKTYLEQAPYSRA